MKQFKFIESHPDKPHYVLRVKARNITAAKYTALRFMSRPACVGWSACGD